MVQIVIRPKVPADFTQSACAYSTKAAAVEEAISEICAHLDRRRILFIDSKATIQPFGTYSPLNASLPWRNEKSSPGCLVPDGRPFAS